MTQQLDLAGGKHQHHVAFSCGSDIITLLPSNHLQRVTIPTGFTRIVASQKNIRYLCGAALRRSRGVELPECENHLKRLARFHFSTMRSMASVLCVTNCSALPVLITHGRGIGCKLTRKAWRRRQRVEGRFRVDKRCWSATFDSGPTRFCRKGQLRQGDLRKRKSYGAVITAE
jgi:hypothetical protein